MPFGGEVFDTGSDLMLTTETGALYGLAAKGSCRLYAGKGKSHGGVRERNMGSFRYTGSDAPIFAIQAQHSMILGYDRNGFGDFTVLLFSNYPYRESGYWYYAGYDSDWHYDDEWGVGWNYYEYPKPDDYYPAPSPQRSLAENVKYWVFDKRGYIPHSNPAWGAEFYDASGSVSYDTGYEPIRIVDVINWTSYSSWPTRTYPAGRQYAVALSLSKGAEQVVKTGGDTAQIRSPAVSVNGGTVSAFNLVTANFYGLSGLNNPHTWHKPVSAIVIDVTGL